MSEIKLIPIGDNLRKQDNRCTANPSFCVQALERIGPIAISCADDGKLMFHDHETSETYYPDGPDEDLFAEMKTEWEDGDLPKSVSVGGYVERWKHVQTCFTEDGCKRYLDQDGHNLRHYHGTRIYVESFNRNPEMIEIREFLLETK
jgi:hypothetical protein